MSIFNTRGQPLTVTSSPTFNALNLEATSSQMITSSSATTPTTVSIPTMGQATTLAAYDPGQAAAAIALSLSGSSTAPLFKSITITPGSSGSTPTAFDEYEVTTVSITWNGV